MNQKTQDIWIDQENADRSALISSAESFRDSSSLEPRTEVEVGRFEYAALLADPLLSGNVIELSGAEILSEPAVFQDLANFALTSSQSLSQHLKTDSNYVLWKLEAVERNHVFDRGLLGNTVALMEQAGLVVSDDNGYCTLLIPNYPLHCCLMQLRYRESYIPLLPQNRLASEGEARRVIRAGYHPYCLSEKGIGEYLSLDGDPEVTAFAALMHDRAHQILRSSLDPQARKVCTYIDQLILLRANESSEVEDLFTSYLPNPVLEPISWRERQAEIMVRLSELSYEFLEADFIYGISVDSHRQRVVPFEQRPPIRFEQILNSVIGRFETSILDLEQTDLVARMLATHILFNDFVLNEAVWTQELSIVPERVQWRPYSGDSYKLGNLVRAAKRRIKVEEEASLSS